MIVNFNHQILTLLIISTLSRGDDDGTHNTAIPDDSCADQTDLEGIKGLFFSKNSALTAENIILWDNLVNYIDISDGTNTYTLGLKFPYVHGFRFDRTLDIQLFAYDFTLGRSEERATLLEGFKDVEPESTESLIAYINNGTLIQVRLFENIFHVERNKSKAQSISLRQNSRGSFIIFKHKSDFVVNLLDHEHFPEKPATWRRAWSQVLLEKTNFQRDEDTIVVLKGGYDYHDNIPHYYIPFEHPYYHGWYYIVIFKDATYAIIKDRKLLWMMVKRQDVRKIRRYPFTSVDEVLKKCFGVYVAHANEDNQVNGERMHRLSASTLARYSKTIGAPSPLQFT